MTRTGIRRTAVGLFALLAFCLAAMPAAAAAKLPQTLSAVDTFVIRSTEDSFPLLALEASSDAADGARLTYSVVSGGDVIRVEGDRVDVIGWGDARIHIRADETAGYQAAERFVDVRVVKDPDILLSAGLVLDGEARIDVAVEGGSYTAADLYGWSFAYRRAGSAEAYPVPIDWPGYLDFYFFLSRLEAPGVYEVLVSADYTDRVTGEERRAEAACTLRTGEMAGGTVSGRVVDELESGEGITVSLWSDGAVVATDTPLSQWGAFFLEGIPDGWYYLAAQAGQRTTTVPLLVEEGQEAEPLVVRMGAVGTVVEADAGVQAVCTGGLEALARVPATVGGTEEYRLTIRRRLHEELSGSEQSRFQNAAGSGGSIGMYLDIGLQRTTWPVGGGSEVGTVRALSEPLSFVVSLPGHLLAKADYRVLREHGGEISVLEAAWDEAAGTLTFETDRLSTFAILYSDSGPLPPDVGAGQQPEMGEEESLPVMAPPEQSEPGPDRGRVLGALAVALIGVAGAATAIVVILRRWRNPAPIVIEPPQLPPELFLEEPEEPPPEKPAEPELSEEERKEQELRMRLYPSGVDPADEAPFFNAIEERKKLKRLYESGQLSLEQFRELERDILLRM